MIETTRDRRDVGLRFAANYDSLILNRFVNISSAETEWELVLRDLPEGTDKWLNYKILCRLTHTW